LSFPWRRFTRERLVLALIALTAFGLVQKTITQDETRLALSQSIIERGSLNIDPWAETSDRSFYRGHWYTDKAPGFSFAAIPAVAAVRAFDVVVGNESGRAWGSRGRSYVLRLLVNGPLLLGFALVVGRLSEGLAAGTGPVAAVVAGLGTLAGPLATVSFSHVGAALLCLGTFLLAWRRRPLLAGLCGGAAVLFEYQAALVVVLVGLYVLAGGLRPALRYVAGGIPAAVVLGLYNLLAFGSPLNLSYEYLANEYADPLSRGFFGIHQPTLESLRAVLLAGSGFSVAQGLLVTSPVLIAAVLGLVLLFRRGLRAEALLCAAVAALFLVVTSGYEFSFGGTSPGPRFMAPALGFLLVGLPEALRRWPRATGVLALVSIGIMTFNSLAWLDNGSLSFVTMLPTTVWSAAGMPKEAGVALVFASAGAASVAAFWEFARASLARVPPRPFRTHAA
jgi:hypothetical protein